MSNLLKVQKLLCIAVWLFCIGVVNVFAQEQHVTVELRNATLRQVFKSIERQTTYRFSYRNAIVDNNNDITISKHQVSVSAVLDEVLKDRNLSYSIVSSKSIVISDKPVQKSTTQPKKIKGTVKAVNGDPIIGANVVVQGTTIGCITDIDGNFILEVPSDGKLTISYIGYLAQDVSVTDKTSYNVVLKEDTEMLDEVVVVGFGTQKKINLTGAVGTVTAEDLKERPVQNVVQALQGKIPGLNISASGNVGELNSSPDINIRGMGTIGNSSGAPLVLIDGMEGNMRELNPQDIENISVLKDAAASSIYGSRAPFGVILITTKKGKEGTIKVNYNNNFRWSTPVMVPESMNSIEHVYWMNDMAINSSGSAIFDAPYVQRVEDYFYGKLDPNDVMEAKSDGRWNIDRPNANVDWYKEYYRDWSPSQEHTASITGGTEKWKYYASLNYLTQEGLMRHGTDTYDRFASTVSLIGQINKYVQVDLKTRFVRTDYDRATSMDGGFYLNMLRRARPTRSVYDPNGHYASEINYVNALDNGGRHNEQNDMLSQQATLLVTPLKNWNIRAEFNYRVNTGFTHEHAYKIYSYYADGVTRYQCTATGTSNDYVSESAFKSNYFAPNIYTDYTFDIQKHNFKVMAGFQSESYRQRYFSAKRSDLISEDVTELDKTTSQKDYSINGNRDRWATAGVFGRVNYVYDDKYLAELNLRYDGSSRFRKDNRWNLFTSFSLGWNLIRENFMEFMQDHVQSLKLRGSYGELGNQNTILLYPTYQIIPTGTSNGSWLIDGMKPNTASAPELISTTLTWERIRNWNVGLDWGLFNNRLTGSFDYYQRSTLDMVGPAPTLPATLGTAVPQTNNTDLRTMGYELSIGWRDQIKDFSYGIQFTLADSRTKILDYPNEKQSIQSPYIAGRYTGEIWGYTTIGIAKSQEEMDAHLATLPNGGQNAIGSSWGAGDIMFADINGDGKVSSGAQTLNDPGDMKVIGNNTPRYMYGINVNLAWKGFDLSMFWQGIGKRDYMPPSDNMVFWGAGGGEWWSASLKPHLDYFRTADSPLGENLDSYYPRPRFWLPNSQSQTGYLQNAAYIRLKNLQIGYTLPHVFTQKVGIESCRLFLSGENLLTFTNLSETMDPESVGLGGNGATSTEGSVYPLSRVFSVGLSVNF